MQPKDIWACKKLSKHLNRAVSEDSIPKRIWYR